jgi:hypothetical protein
MFSHETSHWKELELNGNDDFTNVFIKLVNPIFILIIELLLIISKPNKLKENTNNTLKKRLQHYKDEIQKLKNESYATIISSVISFLLYAVKHALVFSCKVFMVIIIGVFFSIFFVTVASDKQLVDDIIRGIISFLWSSAQLVLSDDSIISIISFLQSSVKLVFSYAIIISTNISFSLCLMKVVSSYAIILISIILFPHSSVKWVFCYVLIITHFFIPKFPGLLSSCAILCGTITLLELVFQKLKVIINYASQLKAGSKLEKQRLHPTVDQLQDQLKVAQQEWQFDLIWYNDEHRQFTVDDPQQLQTTQQRLQDDQQKLQNDQQKLQNDQRKLQNDQQKLQNDQQKLQDDQQKLQNDQQKLQDDQQKLQNDQQKLQDDQQKSQNDQQKSQNDQQKLKDEYLQQLQREGKVCAKNCVLCTILWSCQQELGFYLCGPQLILIMFHYANKKIKREYLKCENILEIFMKCKVIDSPESDEYLWSDEMSNKSEIIEKAWNALMNMDKGVCLMGIKSSNALGGGHCVVCDLNTRTECGTVTFHDPQKEEKAEWSKKEFIDYLDDPNIAGLRLFTVNLQELKQIINDYSDILHHTDESNQTLFVMPVRV